MWAQCTSPPVRRPALRSPPPGLAAGFPIDPPSGSLNDHQPLHGVRPEAQSLFAYFGYSTSADEPAGSPALAEGIRIIMNYPLGIVLSQPDEVVVLQEKTCKV
jgi:hypothetical protein